LDVSADKNWCSGKLRYLTGAKVKVGEGSNELEDVSYASEMHLIIYQGKQFN
jgi:hypothetical protein